MSTLFCPIRKKIVRATPEERVRQDLLVYLVGSFGCPPALISVEISLGALLPMAPAHMKSRRVDIVCFANMPKGTFPLILIECKRSRPTISVFAQLCGYNLHLESTVSAVAWPGMISLYQHGGLIYSGGSDHMPAYEQLKHGL